MINIDDSYTIITNNLRGRKPKFKLKKDNKTYIYKYGPVNYEIWAELIAEQLGLQAGIPMAHYQLASYKNTIGVLTDYFLGPLELIISSDNLKDNVQAVYDENNIPGILKDNTVKNIVTAATIYDDRVDPEQLSLDLMLRWCFYGAILESDKNETNIGFIKKFSALALTPDYDNSSMACLNKNINNILDSLRNGQNLYSYTDNIKTNLKICAKDTGNFLVDFDNFSKTYPKQCEICMEHINNINLEEAFDTVETINQCEIPWEVKFWVTKAISTRIEDMNEIFNNNKKNNPKIYTKKEPTLK